MNEHLTAQSEGNFIQTFTRKRFEILNPTLESIDIIDIAHAGSNICRFTGHTKRFYSVAEHAYRVACVMYKIDPDNKNWGLMHDAAESYLLDMASPVKVMMPSYRSLEDEILEKICFKFGLCLTMPASVKRADMFMLAVEARDLLEPLLPGWWEGEKWVLSQPDLISLWEGSKQWRLLESAWTPQHAKKRFLEEFCRLFPKYVESDSRLKQYT